MDRFKWLLRLWRCVCLCVQVIRTIRAFAWFSAWFPKFLDRLDTHDDL